MQSEIFVCQRVLSNLEEIKEKSKMFGKGTKATINYKVVERKVTKVTITEKVDMMKLGESAMFKAVVEGENLDNTSIIWE